MSSTSGCPVVHFEIGCKDLAVTTQFYIGPITLPDSKQFAWFKDPEGNMVGLVTKAAK